MRLKQILFVELLGGIGDLVMALPSVHGLALSHPAARVSVFSFWPGVELLAADPKVARVFAATKGDRADGTPLAKDELANVLSNHSFDLVVSDTRYGGIDDLIESSTAKQKVTRLWHLAGRDERIERVFLRNLIGEGWIRSKFADDSPRLAITDAEMVWAREWYADNAPKGKRAVLLNPDSGVAVKRWLPERFVAVGKELLAQRDVQVLIVAGERAGVAKDIADGIGPDAQVMPWMPLRQLASLVAQASLFISVDTGPAKIAAAVGTPTVALFGPTWAGRYGLPSPNVNLQSPFQCDHLQPMNFTLQPCWYSGRCAYTGKATCMEDIEPQVVITAALKMLRSTLVACPNRQHFVDQRSQR